MTETEKYVAKLTTLKSGDLGLLRLHAGRDLDHSVAAFDLFTGLWWPLRKESPRVPRRKVAWLVAKLYAFRPIPHDRGKTLARQLRRCEPNNDGGRFRQKFDLMLTLSLDEIEPALQWALDLVGSQRLNIDWVKLTDDLSIWEREETRLRWAEELLAHNERRNEC